MCSDCYNSDNASEHENTQGLSAVSTAGHDARPWLTHIVLRIVLLRSNQQNTIAIETRGAREEDWVSGEETNA